MLTQSAVQSQPVSTSPLTEAQVWGSSDRKRKSKPVVRTISATKKKLTESLKDVIFVNDPAVYEVPRKSDRSFYYENGLVALSVRFYSDMFLNCCVTYTNTSTHKRSIR